ncbi:MAG: DUF11 domain-containing protein, partial [Caldilineaceae bacterium]|nr:DUF11 domain-containing protein [Caldilineaceae bacterium]
SVDRITIEAGQTVTCTFTATQLGKLIVRKATTPNPDFTNTQFQFSAGGGLTPTAFALHSNELQSFANLTPRSGYTVAEQSNTDWRLATATCDNNSSPTNIRVDPGQTVTCTFTNEATAIRLDLTMSDNEIVAEPGDTIVYTLHYRNGGNQDATGAFIQMQVPPFTTFAGPSPLWSCPLGATAGTQCTYTIGTLSGGVTAGQVQFKARVNQTVPANVSQIDSTATLGYSAMANAAVSSEQTPLKAIVGLSLQKDDGGVSVSATDYVTYTLTYGNSGTQAAANVTISETVPANTSFTGPTGLWSCASGSPAGTHCFHNVGTVNAGNGGTVPFVVQVNESLPTAVEAIDNSATIGSSTQPNSDFGTERTELLATPDLVLRLVAIDVAVSPGELLHYRISYLNQGSQDASGVALTALLPEHVQFSAANSSDGWQCINTTCQLAIGTLASGSSGVVDFVLLLDRPIPAGLTAITLTAQVGDDGLNGPESATENNHASVETAVIAPTDFFATKQDSLVVDADGDGVVSPGDTIEYTIVLRNNSGVGLRQIAVTDPLDANLQLIGSITTDHGTIVEGNHTADRRVVVQVGDLAGAGGSATIRFRTTIRTPLPVGIGTVQNQATISSPDFTNRLTDDPDTADRRDATVTAVHTTVALQATLRDTLLVDADHNGKVTVGDTIVYELFLQNHSNVDADLLSLVVPLDANVVLLPQSVATSYGEVAEGSDGEHQMEIVMDGLAATASVQATFQVKIVNPTTSIQHQAVIWSAGVGGQEAGTSDDPDTDTPGDATVTVVASTDTVTYQLYLPEVHR